LTIVTDNLEFQGMKSRPIFVLFSCNYCAYVYLIRNTQLVGLYKSSNNINSSRLLDWPLEPPMPVTYLLLSEC